MTIRRAVINEVKTMSQPSASNTPSNTPNNTNTKPARKRTRAVKAAEAAPVAAPVAEAVAEVASVAAPVAAPVKRVGPVQPREPEADITFMAVAPGDTSPIGVKEFWRRLGPALAHDLPAELLRPLVTAFEQVVVTRCSVDAAVESFMPLANNAYGLGRAGFKGGVLHRELAIEFLAGFTGAFLTATAEHVARAIPGAGIRQKEVAVLHVLGLCRTARAAGAAYEDVTRELSGMIDRLGDARRALVHGVGATRAAGLDSMLLNAWVEADPRVLANWVEATISKKAPRQMAAALANAHLVVEVGQ